MVVFYLQYFLSRLINFLRKGKDQNRTWQAYENRIAEIKNLGITIPEGNYSLIVRLDDIGDFVLFANSLKAIFENGPIGSQWIFLGNESWKQLFLEIFGEYPIKCFWMNKNLWFSNENYRKEFLIELSEFGPKQIYFASHTRVLLLEGIIKQFFISKNCYGFKAKDGPFSNELNKEFIDLFEPNLGLHELEINHHFTEWILQTNLKISRQVVLPNHPIKLKVPYFVICTGGKQKSKQWPVSNYIWVANKILNKYPDLTCVMVGLPSEFKDAEKVQNKLEKYRVINLCGKTDIIELTQICKKARFTLSNDTSVAHFSSLQGIPTIVVVNGNRFGRFFPYPKDFQLVRAIYPKGFKQITYDWEGKTPISGIKKNQVYTEVIKLISEIS